MNVWASVWAPPGFLRVRRNLLLAHKMQTGGKFKFRQPSAIPSPASLASSRRRPCPLFCPSSGSLRLALVSRRNQPRADNNEIHKSVREHGTPTRASRDLFSLSLPPTSLSPPFPPATPQIVYSCSARYLSHLASRGTFVTLDRVLLRSESAFTTLRVPRNRIMYVCLSGFDTSP